MTKTVRKLVDENVAVLDNARLNGKYFKLTFRSRRLAGAVEPGQFLNIQISPEIFLRRPFSYYRVRGERIEILYEILGRGTDILSRKRKGDPLTVLGPLGRPFSRRSARKKRLLVAGGVGVPPLVFLAEKVRTDYLLIGTKSKAEVLPRKELAGVKARVLYSTNDGSYGKRGYVTALLEPLVEKEGAENLFIQTCGPNIMMKAVMEIARREGIKGEASLDEPMACGLGACLGCMVKTRDGWTPSCTEGPVFRFDEIESF